MAVTVLPSLRPRALLVILATALQGCAAEPPSRTTSDASADADEGLDSPDGRSVDFSASPTCSSTTPRVVPLPTDGDTAACLFQLIPPMPYADDQISLLLVDGVELPATEYELHGGDVVELKGQACADYRAGTITSLSVVIACSAR